MKTLLPLITILILGLAVSGQKAADLTLAESIDLTDGKVCGDPKFTTTFSITGTVVKRQFADNETTLNGVVIADKKDQRYFVNIDADYLNDTVSGGTIDSLSDVLLRGKYVRVKADVCGKIYVMRRVKSLKL